MSELHWKKYLLTIFFDFRVQIWIVFKLTYSKITIYAYWFKTILYSVSWNPIQTLLHFFANTLKGRNVLDIIKIRQSWRGKEETNWWKIKGKHCKHIGMSVSWWKLSNVQRNTREKQLCWKWITTSSADLI